MTPDEQLEAARTPDEVLRALYRGSNVQHRDVEPEDPGLLTPGMIAAWLPQCSASAKEDSAAEFSELLRRRNLENANDEWMVVNGSSNGDNLWPIDRVHAEWLKLPDEMRPLHPLIPVVEAWEENEAHTAAHLKRAGANVHGFLEEIGCDGILEALAPWKAALLLDDFMATASILETLEARPDEIAPAQPVYHLATRRGRLEVATHSTSTSDPDRLDADHYWLPNDQARSSVVVMRTRDNALTLKTQLHLFSLLEAARNAGDKEKEIEKWKELESNFASGAGTMRTNGGALMRRLILLPESPTAPPPPEGRSLMARLVTDLWTATERPRGLSFAKATVTGGRKSGMTRRVQIVSTMRRVGWTPEEGRPGAVVDGEPMAAALPDPANQFPIRQRRPRRKYRPGEQRELAFPPSPSIPQDMRLLALQEVSADRTASYVLPGDVLVLLTLAHLADHPFELTEQQGAALIVRNLAGGPRAVQPQHDYPRFWNGAYELRSLVLWEPNGGYRWVDLATVEVPKVSPVDRITIGPPVWARGTHVGKWTLTAEGSAASLMRVTAGKQNLAGRIVTGLEYRLASGWSGKPNTVAPYLRPEHPRRKGSPGPAVLVSWREAMFGAGDWWDVTDPKEDKAALNRYSRALARLESRGYFVGENLNREAPAGDSVEIVCRQRAARGAHGRPTGLLVRASARFVEAARLAQLPRGKGFDSMLLTDYTGLDSVPIRTVL